jgi:hypothetical protein
VIQATPKDPITPIRATDIGTQAISAIVLAGFEFMIFARFESKFSVCLASSSLQVAKQMPIGPKGEKRPADVIGNAIHVMRIATGEIEETLTDDGKNAAAVALGRMGGKARAKSMTAKRRSEIAKKAAKTRWKDV